MGYRTTRTADEDLSRIYDESDQQFGTGQAERYIAGLLAKFNMLARFPQSARLRHEFTPPLRIQPHVSHMIIYQEDKDGIIILRVIPARANWQVLLS